MTVAFDTMFPASFKGVSFFYISGDISGGRKTITHEYPNKNFRFVEDLGLNLRTFSVTGIIQGPLYPLLKIALENVLNDPGIGILIHPFVGIVEVTCTGFTVSESLATTGIATYTMTFAESFRPTFPDASLNNISKIANLLEEIYSSVGGEFNSAYSSFFGKNITLAGFKFLELSGSLLKIGDSISSVQENDTEFTAESRIYQENAFFNAGPDGDPGNTTSSLIQSFDSLTEVGEDRFELSSRLIGFGFNDEFLNLDSKEILERNKNFKLINGLVNGLAFVNLCDSAKDINYSTEDDLNEVANNIDEAYNRIVNNDSIVLTPTFLDQIQSIRTQIRIFFDQIRLVVNKIIEVTTPELPMTIIAYSFYGDTSEYDELLSLNNITNPAFVSGTIKILES